MEKYLEASHMGKKMDIDWTHDTFNNKHHFALSGIQRQKEETYLKLSWDGSKFNIKNKGEEIIPIPSFGDFKVTSVQVRPGEDQFVEISFSDLIKKDQSLKGLVTIQGVNVTRISAEGSVIKAYPKTHLSGNNTVSISNGIESVLGTKLENKYTTTLNFGGIKPGIQLIGKGNIMPENHGLIFPFEAVNLNAVDVRITKVFVNNINQFFQQNNLNGQSLSAVGRVIHRAKIDLTSTEPIDYGTWNSFPINLSDLIDVEVGAIYQVELGFRKAYSLYTCNNTADEDIFCPVELEEKDGNSSYENLFYNRFNYWRSSDDPCKHEYYNPSKFIKRNILGSNFGIVAKKNGLNRLYVAVNNLLDCKPENNVDVQVFDFQNQLIQSQRTNSEGITAIDCERSPFLLVARKGDNIGYLRLNDGGTLSLSQFDVSGRTYKKGIKGFVYAERGVWRPGDSIYTSFILEDKLNILPKGHPIVMEIRNPKGQLTEKIVRNKSERSIYPFFFKTAQNDPTGNWQCKISVGGSTFYKEVQVETVKPNRLKVNLNFDNEVLKANENNKALLNSKWLHGTPAKNLKAKVNVSFSTFAPYFDQFKEFDFSTPYSKFDMYDKVIFENMLDEKGNAEFEFNFSPQQEIPGFVKCTFLTRVYEKGGNSSVNHFSKKLSPYDSYVGVKIPWSYKRWNKVDTDVDNVIEIATANSEGEPVSDSKVNVKLYKLKYRWWYHGNHENLASYAGTTHHQAVIDTTIKTLDGLGKLSTNISDDLWGRYLLLVTNSSGHTCGKVILYDWPWGRKGKKKTNAQMLALISDKENYNVGDDVSISFSANPKAKALISIETATDVIQQTWVEDVSEFTTYQFKALAHMAPNVYVSVHLFQPNADNENDLPIRLYGILPVLVENPESRLAPVITMPEVLRPEKEFNLSLEEKDGKPMDYTIAIVDEGLLDLTNFKTPKPWGAFYAREAHGIKTWDVYDYIFGAYGSKMENMFAVGGGFEEDDESKKKADRFKPVVKVLGPFHLDKKQKISHSITLPNYVGSVRTMVIAANNGSYGQAENTTPVRDPLMVLATMPRVISPEEAVDLPVSIFALEDRIKDVNITLTSNDLIEIIGSETQKVTFKETGEKDITFKVKAAQKVGVAKVKITATSGSEMAHHEIELDVRLSNPPTIRNDFKILDNNQSILDTLKLFGIEGTQKGMVEISTIPPLNLNNRLRYLIQYPHGCIEQTTSSVFPQLKLPMLLSLSEKQQERIENNIKAGIVRLNSFRVSDGGFAYWPGGSHSNEWGTCYAGYFMLEAEKAGYHVPATMKSDWLKYMKQKTNAYTYSSDDYSMGQAFRLFLLAKAKAPQISAMNRLRTVSSSLSQQSRWLLAGAYALIGQKEAAYKIIDLRNTKVNENYRHYYHYYYGSQERDQAIILQVLNELNEKELGHDIGKMLAQKLSSTQWLSTQSTAYCLLALSDFYGSNPSDEITYHLTIGNKETHIIQNELIKQIEVNGNPDEEIQIKIANGSSNQLFVNLITEGVLPGIDNQKVSDHLDLTVVYQDLEGHSIDVTNLDQGTEFMAVLTVSNSSGSRVRDIALNHLIPSGWEITNTRLFNGVSEGKNSAYDYQDLRDDRVYTYFSLGGNDTKKYSIRLNASYAGEFIMPSITVGAMYDNTYFAKYPGQKIEVNRVD